MTTVYITGVFDILHKGHLRALRKAKELGDVLIVGVQDRKGAFENKAKEPLLTIDERVEQIKELPFVDKVVVYTNTTIETIETIRPDVFAHSPEWRNADRKELIKFMNKRGIVMAEIPYFESISTTEIERRIYGTNRV